MKSIEDQINAMAERWPRFRIAERDGRYARWEGSLAPVKRPFSVSIGYQVPLVIENWSVHQVQPRVRVLAPALELHADYEEGPLPHVYWNREDPPKSCLCLFRPDIPEWTTDDLIAETTVHWAAEWLYFYEGWLVTRKWFGGGWHPAADAGVKRL